MQLYSPWVLLLLLILPVMVFMRLRRKTTAAIKFPSLMDMKNCLVSWRIRLRPLLLIARLICIALLIFALARPRKGTVLSEISTKGVAIEVVEQVPASGNAVNGRDLNLTGDGFLAALDRHFVGLGGGDCNRGAANAHLGLGGDIAHIRLNLDRGGVFANIPSQGYGITYGHSRESGLEGADD